MPCQVSSDVHEWINEGPTVPIWNPVNPHYLVNSPRTPSGMRRPCGPLLQPVAGIWLCLQSVVGSRLIPVPPGTGVGANGTPTFYNHVSYRRVRVGTTVGGQFGWGGTPSKKYQGGPKIGSGGTETRCRVQRQKLV